MTIKELKDLREKLTVVDGIELGGKVTQIYQRYTGTGEFGDYSLQNIIINDDTDSIMVNLRNCPEANKDLIGKAIHFKSVYAEHLNRNVGVKIVEETYEDRNGVEKTVVKAIVTKSAQTIIGVIGAEPIPPKSTEFVNITNVAFETTMKSCIIKAAEILSDATIVEQLHRIIEAGWESEDLRTVAISLAIDIQRRGGR